MRYGNKKWQLVTLRIFKVVEQTTRRRDGERQLVAAKSTQIACLKVLIQLGAGAVFIELPGRETSDCDMVGQCRDTCVFGKQ